MSSPHDDNEKDRGQVLPFRRRTLPPTMRVGAFSNLSSADSPVQDIEKYDRDTREPDDYAHRMKMNALAVLALALLIGGGMWIVDTMAQQRKTQDCVLMGRRNCGQINMSPDGRGAPPVMTPQINR